MVWPIGNYVYVPLTLYHIGSVGIPAEFPPNINNPPTKGMTMQVSTYCAKCKTKQEIKSAEVMNLVTIGSAYVCTPCKKASK